MISIIWIMSFVPMKFIDFLSKLFMHKSSNESDWKCLHIYCSVECWLCGPVLWCRRCHAVHVLPVPRGRFTTGNLQLFMWRSLGRDNGNIWTQHSQSTHPHTPTTFTQNFILTFHWLRNVSSYSHLSTVECWGKPPLDPALSVLVRQSAIRVWPPPRPGSGSVGVSPALCPAARRCQHHVLLIKMACEHKLSWPGSWGLHTPQPILKSTKQHYHYYIDPNLYFSSRRNVKW